MSVKERIKEFIKSKKMTISDFEKQINVANGYVNSISKGIGTEKIEIILEKYPNLNIEWLITGTGEMLKPDRKNETDSHTTIELLLNILKEKDGKIEELNRKVGELQVIASKSRANTITVNSLPAKKTLSVLSKSQLVTRVLDNLQT
ncbi:MAG: helix-turn-helix domain-containing protein [Prevotellaceae bacterium]|jgi:transcriptional regulator with XRE-family HTH domain|nr:helix-turn-helix domain-containing protein [Prevotellaceae bacterium]